MNRILLGYSPDLDVFDDTRGAGLESGRTQRGAVAFDTESTELAAELLDVVGQPGFAALLARLVRRKALASGRALSDAVATELAGLLQLAARRGLPVLHAPESAGAGSASTRASRFYGIELEGLSPEDQEFEAARRFAQLATEAARLAAVAQSRLPPDAAARQAVAQAAKRYAPGWLNARGHAQPHAPAAQAALAPHSSARTGRWLRHGPELIVLNH